MLGSIKVEPEVLVPIPNASAPELESTMAVPVSPVLGLGFLVLKLESTMPLLGFPAPRPSPSRSRPGLSVPVLLIQAPKTLVPVPGPSRPE